MHMAPLVLALLVDLAHAGSAIPRIEAIVFEGNRVTRESVLRRELAVVEGQPADPARIEASRQALMDLGLFRSVEVELEELPEGGQRLRFVLREKRYLLPIPRLDGNVDGDYSYGAQLRWANVGGRNHSLTAWVQQARFSEDRAAERQRGSRLSYTAPHLLGENWAVQGSVEQIQQQTVRRQRAFEERFDRLQLLVVHDLRHGRPRSGWRFGSGIYAHRQQSFGELAPPSDGRAIALVGLAEFDDQRFALYSETGQRLSLRLEHAPAGLGDFGYRQVQARYRQARAIGDRPHQTLQLLAELGLRDGGPDSRNPFSLGGGSRLRGYPVESFEGQRYLLGQIEALRPLYWDALRLLLVAEVGWTDRDVFDARASGIAASVGIGLRLRLTWFVDVELELGIARPLRDGQGWRVFGSGG